LIIISTKNIYNLGDVHTEPVSFLGPACRAEIRPVFISVLLTNPYKIKNLSYEKQASPVNRDLAFFNRNIGKGG